MTVSANRDPQRGEKGKILVRQPDSPGQVKQLGPYGIESLISTEEEDRATAYRVSIAAGKKTGTSYHQLAEELYFVVSGSGRAWLDGKEEVLKTGVFLRLPPGTRHAFEAWEEGLELLNIHTPGCRPNRDVHFEGGPPPGGFA
ncbi:MAG: cupin domain-containing protein [Gemmataceae bacterium]|nr:cupin domain-containing protein [Gemmataceae bacterium]